jgi:hypothetical protein
LNGYYNEKLFEGSEEGQEVLALLSEEKLSIITKEILVRHWGIGLDSAHQTLKKTMLRGVCPFVNPTDQRECTHCHHLAFLTMKNKENVF